MQPKGYHCIKHHSVRPTHTGVCDSEGMVGDVGLGCLRSGISYGNDGNFSKVSSIRREVALLMMALEGSYLLASFDQIDSILCFIHHLNRYYYGQYLHSCLAQLFLIHFQAFSLSLSS